jgi:hypothetical protein
MTKNTTNSNCPFEPNKVMLVAPNPKLVGLFNVMDPDAVLKPEDLELLMEEVGKEAEASLHQAREDMFDRIGQHVAQVNNSKKI